MSCSDITLFTKVSSVLCLLLTAASIVNDGDVDTAVEARVRNRWNKFRQLASLLTNKDVSLLMRGKLYRG